MGRDNTGTNACVTAFFGDGYVWAAHEECVDGNGANSDDYEHDCTVTLM